MALHSLSRLRGLFSISKNFQTARFRTLEELQTWDRVRKLPFEILPLKPVPMLRFERNLTGNKKLYGIYFYRAGGTSWTCLEAPGPVLSLLLAEWITSTVPANSLRDLLIRGADMGWPPRTFLICANEKWVAFLIGLINVLLRPY